MAWEQRRHGSYYYRKVWRDGTCQSEYGGTGLLASYAAILDERERDQRTLERLATEKFKREQDDIDQDIDRHHNAVRELVVTVLQQAGFHRHKGTWRKARKVVKQIAKKPTQEEISEYGRLYHAADGKKPGAAEVKRMKEYADDHPVLFDGLSMFWITTLETVIESMTSNEATRVHVKAETKALQRTLGYDQASPMEKLLIKDIVMCWLRLHSFEQIYTQQYEQGVSLAKGLYLEKKLSCTRRRYHQAVETLARVRGLLARAAVQINVAQQQIVQNN